jgi:hypothetical protein
MMMDKRIHTPGRDLQVLMLIFIRLIEPPQEIARYVCPLSGMESPLFACFSISSSPRSKGNV